MSPEDGDRVVGKTVSSETYHFLTGDETRSPCGALDNDRFWSADVAVTLSQSDAEQQGFTVCARCADHGKR